MKLFGIQFSLARPEEERQKTAQSFVPRETDDGAAVVAASGSYGTFVDLDGAVRSEAELVTKYRKMVESSGELDTAVDEIVCEAMATDSDEVVKIDLDDVDATKGVKDEIERAFKKALELTNFRDQSYDVFRRWYVDGRINYHLVVDKARATEGIQELRYIDPRKIRKIREVVKKPLPGQNSFEAVFTQEVNEYYVFSDKGFSSQQKGAVGVSTDISGLKIAKDSVVSVTSGLLDAAGTTTLSYLHKAIKPLNMLTVTEDATVIYTLSRAPERRVWYIDVGTLPKMKAEQYVRDIMVKHKNRTVYDAATGEIRDDRKFMTLLEDFWLPRREGGRSTEVTTLPAGQHLGEMDHVQYFLKKLYSALHVPVSRLDNDSLFTLGHDGEMTRDEVRFANFVKRLRNRFATLFTKIMERELVLTQRLSLEEWNRVKKSIKYEFAHDNYFKELTDTQILQTRTDLLTALSPWIGRFFSNEWITRNVLRQTEEDVEEMRSQIEAEMTDSIYSQPMPGMEPALPPEDGDGFGGPEDPGGGQLPPPSSDGQQPPNGPKNGASTPAFLRGKKKKWGSSTSDKDVGAAADVIAGQR